ncbi:MAG: hemolysin family protein [Synechocystis sp.]|nr:hemolysin family protein [Synechocystis sp.]
MNEIVNRLLLVLVLLGINAFFVMAEFSIVATRRSRIRQLVDAGNLPAKQVQYFHRHLDRLLSTTQIGITGSCLALGWLGESTFAALLQPWLQLLNVGNAIPLSHFLALFFTFMAIAYLQIVLGELVPKSLAFIYAEQLACALAPPLHVISRLLMPFNQAVNYATRTLLGIGGIEITRASWSHHVTPEELKFIINTEGDTLGLEPIERSLFKNVLAFGELTAADVMIPRTKIDVIAAAATYGDLLDLITQTGHRIFPVKGDSLDDIQGLIDFQDLALPLQQNLINRDTPIQPWIKTSRFLPESMPLPELLQKMQRTQAKSVMIVDEFGGTAGFVCWQDVINEFLDPTQVEEEHEDSVILQMLDPRTFVVEAQMTLDELNDVLGFSFPNNDNYQTLGGFLLYEWQRIPQQGESLTYGHYSFTVVAADGPKLQKIRIHRQTDIAPAIDPNKMAQFPQKTRPQNTVRYSSSRAVG